MRGVGLAVALALLAAGCAGSGNDRERATQRLGGAEALLAAAIEGSGSPTAWLNVTMDAPAPVRQENDVYGRNGTLRFVNQAARGLPGDTPVVGTWWCTDHSVIALPFHYESRLAPGTGCAFTPENLTSWTEAGLDDAIAEVLHPPAPDASNFLQEGQAWVLRAHGHGNLTITLGPDGGLDAATWASARLQVRWTLQAPGTPPVPPSHPHRLAGSVFFAYDSSTPSSVTQRFTHVAQSLPVDEFQIRAYSVWCPNVDYPDLDEAPVHVLPWPLAEQGAGNFSFLYTDKNANGLIDDGDTLRTTVPDEPHLYWYVFDSWADQASQHVYPGAAYELEDWRNCYT